jgi:hypothetical protein
MIIIQSSTIAGAWRETIKQLYERGRIVENNEIFRDETVCIEVTDTTKDLIDGRFPIPKKQIEIINHFFLTGEKESEVTHEWTKLYRKRLFDSEPNQIQGIIKYLVPVEKVSFPDTSFSVLRPEFLTLCELA